MSPLAILAVPLCYSIIFGTVVYLIAGETAGWRAVLLSGFMLFATSALYGQAAYDYSPEGNAFFSIPFQAFLSPSITWSVLSQQSIPFLCLMLAGACLFSIPLRKIVTKTVIEHYQGVARAESQVEFQKKRKVLIEEYKKARSDLEIREEAAAKAIESAKQKEDSFNLKLNDLETREKNLVAAEDIFAGKISAFYENVDNYNSRIQDEKSITNELHRQLDIVSRTSEKLKGSLGRVMPFKVAWKKLIKNCDKPEVVSYLKTLLDEAKADLKENKNKKSCYSPRPSIPSLKPIQTSIEK